MKQEIKAPVGLVGWRFLTRKDGVIHYQGIIRTKITDTLYIAQLFSWIDGSPTDSILVDIAKLPAGFSVDTETAPVLFFETFAESNHRLEKENRKKERKEQSPKK